MRTLIAAPVLVVTALVGWIFLMSSAPSPQLSMGSGVGTYYLTTDLPGTGPVKNLLTVNTGGTAIATDANDPVADQPGLGIWRHIQGGQLELVFLSADHDLSGNLVTINRITVVTSGPPQNLLATSMITFEFFDPSVDPNDPDSVPLGSATVPSTASRLTF